jgi:hypothetical protein
VTWQGFTDEVARAVRGSAREKAWRVECLAFKAVPERKRS